MLDHLENNVDNLNNDVQSFVKKSVEYYKLDFYKKTMKVMVAATRTLLIFGMALMVLLFISIAVAILIGEETGSLSYGFFLVGGFYLLITLLIAIFGKKALERIILTSTSKIFFND